jgi:hypothetical protein
MVGRMTEVLAYIGADPNLVGGALHTFADGITEVADTRACGLGYEQESRMLLRKRPLARPEAVNLARQGSDLRTRAFIGRLTAQRGMAPDNLQPFRWRGWLFASVGELPVPESRASVLATLPDFLFRNVQGQSAAELIFHQFLLRLKAVSVDVAHPSIPEDDVLTALAEVAGELGVPAGLVLTDSRRIFAASTGARLAWAQVDGIRSWREAPLFAGHEPKRANYPHMKAVALVECAGEMSEQWTAVAPGTAVALRVEGLVASQKLVLN